VAAPPPPPPAPVEDGTDHDKAVGAWGIGLLGTQRLTMLGRPGGAGQFNVGMPVVGVRHWVTERYGFQAGIGLNAAGGTIKDNEPGAHDDPNPTTIAMGLHAAAPISLYHDKSYNLLILPGLDFAFGDSRLQDDPDAAGDQATVQKSVLLQASVRAGAEVQFGFIGMPMLSLQGTVGAALGWTNSGIEYTEGGQGRKRNASLWAIGTQNYDEPWDLFVGSIAAVYYFK